MSLAFIEQLAAENPPPVSIVHSIVARATTECPALIFAQGVAITTSAQVVGNRLGTAFLSEHRIKINGVQERATSRLVGTILHELCHIACYREGRPHGDADDAFAIKCRQAFAQWNALPGAVPVDERVSGAYRGRIGRQNVAAAHAAGLERR